MPEQSVLVIGAGIAGLTASALLAHEGLHVTLLEAHSQPGGCAGTFQRGQYVFDVGATQVAGLEPGGIHERLFRHLGISIPPASVLDPGCLVDLEDSYPPIRLWHEPKRWEEERKRHFPDSELFWSICASLHKSNWAFARRDPVLPIRNFWDFRQVFKALRPFNLPSSLLTKLTIGDLLRLCRSDHDQRLRLFLDLQLRLYSQESADRTALLYGATVLQMAQKPLGLWHLQGSMQKLSDQLTSALLRDKTRLLFNHRVVGLSSRDKQHWKVNVMSPKGALMQFQVSDVVCTLPPQSLFDLLPSDWALKSRYLKELENLPQPTGAIVFYGAINRIALPKDCPAHLQIATSDLGSLFLSISQEGDGRAPLGQATLIASAFTETAFWSKLDKSNYQKQKQAVLQKIVEKLETYFCFDSCDWLHQELATPKSFAKWTGRPHGIVGGLGQHPSNFGPFGISSRTPFRGLWLCGDSIHPGEGTAGVSQSALMVCRQLLAEHGHQLNVGS